MNLNDARRAQKTYLKWFLFVSRCFIIDRLIDSLVRKEVGNLNDQKKNARLDSIYVDRGKVI